MERPIWHGLLIMQILHTTVLPVGCARIGAACRPPCPRTIARSLCTSCSCRPDRCRATSCGVYRGSAGERSVRRILKKKKDWIRLNLHIFPTLNDVVWRSRVEYGVIIFNVPFEPHVRSLHPEIQTRERFQQTILRGCRLHASDYAYESPYAVQFRKGLGAGFTCAGARFTNS
jgi:hypothetical protein